MVMCQGVVGGNLVLVVMWQHDKEVGVGGDMPRWFWWCWMYT